MKGLTYGISNWLITIPLRRDECRDKAKRLAAEKKAEEKKAREEARLIEKERKKAEALEAKRYPMEDLQLLQELSAKAGLEGESS